MTILTRMIYPKALAELIKGFFVIDFQPPAASQAFALSFIFLTWACKKG